MRKKEADNIPRVEIKELLRTGLLSGRESGAVLWRSPFSGDIYRFVVSGVFIDKMENPLSDEATPTSLEGSVEFKSVMHIFPDKTGTGWLQQEDPPVWQTASLCTTPCNYGKVRFWF